MRHDPEIGPFTAKWPIIWLYLVVFLGTCVPVARADTENAGLFAFNVSDRTPFKRYKESFFQLMEMDAAWIGSGSDNLNATEVSTFVRLALPFGDTDNILAIQPSLRVYFLDGPEVTDVPAQVVDAALNLVYRKTWSERWESNVWMQPKIRNDFDTSDDAFFFSGGAYAKYEWYPEELSIYLGAFYLDRDDFSVLPGVGFVWTPTPNWIVDITLPRPRVAYRFDCQQDMEKWAYLGGALGGGSFAVTRAAGGTDKLTLYDLRLALGVETVQPGGGGYFAEIGFVFDREIEYKISKEEYEFGEAVMLRAGTRF